MNHTANDLIQKLADKCIHFNGLANDHCKAGVKYETLIPLIDASATPRTPDDRVRWWPCWGGPNAPDVCSERNLLGLDGAKEKEAKIGESFKRTMVARTRIVEITQGKRGVAGVVVCPCCEKGNLRYSVAGNNGHIHASCSTEGCVRWME